MSNEAKELFEEWFYLTKQGILQWDALVEEMKKKQTDSRLLYSYNTANEVAGQ